MSDGGAAPLPRLPRALLRPLALGYAAAVRWRNRGYDRGRGVVRLAVPVISIGNIVAGGTGKTPTTIWLARRLVAHGFHPMIALRGYGAVGSPAESDEAREYRDALPGTPLAVGADRGRAIAALGDSGADVVLLDDGFQHRRIHRDLDLVLVDATRPALEDALLPCGWLREPAAALRRADAVLVTRAAGVDPSLALAIRAVHGREPAAWLRHAWGGFERHDPTPAPAPARTAHPDPHPAPAPGPAPESNSDRELPVAPVEPVERLRGRRVACCAGIGNPEAFARQLEAAGATIVERLPVRDHERYDETSIERLARTAHGADALVVTPKDWVKLRDLPWRRIGVPILVPRLAVEPIHPVESFERLVLERIAERRRAR